MTNTVWGGATCVMLVATLVLGSLVPISPARAEDPVVATVNGQNLTESQLLAELKARYGYMAREAMIISMIIEQYAKSKNMSVTEDEINAAVAKDQAGVQAQGGTMEQWLGSQGLTVMAYRTRVRNNLLLQKVVAEDITNEQVKSVYEKMPPQPEAFHLTYIAVASKEEAEKLRADLVAGTLTWEQAAKQYNLDPYGREKGTDLGWVPKAKLKDDIVANLQRDGDLSQVLEYGGHWAMLRREAYRAQGRPPFEQVEADLREQLTQEAAQRKLMSLMNVADIKRLGDYKQPGQ